DVLGRAVVVAGEVVVVVVVVVVTVRVSISVRVVALEIVELEVIVGPRGQRDLAVVAGRARRRRQRRRGLLEDRAAAGGAEHARRMRAQVSRSLVPWNRARPTSSSCSTTPSENRSARASRCAVARSCSGAMYAYLPFTTPVSVWCVCRAARATPRSISLTMPPS